MDNEDGKEKFFNRAGQIASEKMSQTIDAATRLAGLEGNAARPKDNAKVSGSDDSAQAAQEREEKPSDSSFVNNVGKNRDDKKGGRFGKNKSNSKFSGKFGSKLSPASRIKMAWKKGGPVGILIALLLLGGGGLILGAQTAAPFGIVNRLMEEYNTMNLSNNMRFNKVWKNLARAGKLPKKVLDSMEKEGVKVEVTKSSTGTDEYKFEIEDKQGNKQVATADEAVEKTAFKDKVKSATKQATGQYGGWYDRLASKILGDRGIKFSNWSDYQEDPNDDAATKEKKVKETMENKNDSTDMEEGGGKKKTDDQGHEVDDGISKENSDIIKKSEGREIIADKLQTKAGSMIGNAAAMTTCTGAMAIATIAGIVMDQQLSDMLNLAQNFLEATQKVQAGDGAESPLHEIMLNLTAVDPETGKSALNSDGMAALLGPQNTLGDRANVENANLETVAIKASQVVPNFTACFVAQGVISAVGVVLTFIPGGGLISKGKKIATAVQKLTPKTLAKVVGKEIVKIAGGIAVQEAILKGAEIYAKDVVANMIGGDAGDYIVAGASQIMSTNHRGSGGSPGTQQKVLAFQRRQQEVLAEEADYERRTRSPLDLTSRYTFLGSIAYAMIPIANAAKTASVTDFATASGSVLSNSLAALSPTTSAIATTSLIKTQGTCPYLEGVGAVGDMYCNPYFMSDTDTMGLDIDTVKQVLQADGQIDDASKDTPTIQDRDGESLKNFYKYCGRRYSQYGLFDAKAAEDFQTKTGNPIADFFLQFSDIVGLIDSINQQANTGWITGSNCVANDSEFWQKKGQYYQRFLEDQRLLEDLGAVNNSSLSVLIDKIDAEESQDDSYEARIARVTGLTKEQVVSGFALLDEYKFLADYDPSDLGPMPAENKEEVHDFSSSSVIANMKSDNPTYNSTNFTQHHIIYADLRTRTQIA